MRAVGASILAAAACLLGAGSVVAQSPVVEGRITTGADELAVADAVVELLGTAGERFEVARSDSAGFYRLQAPAPGEYVIRASSGALGMARSALLRLSSGEVRRVDLVLNARGFRLPPLEVRVRAERALLTGRESFEAHRALGRGLFLDSIRILEKRPRVYTDVLRGEEGLWPTLSRTTLWGSREYRLDVTYVFPRAPGQCGYTYIDPVRAPHPRDFPGAARHAGPGTGFYHASRGERGDTVLSIRLAADQEFQPGWHIDDYMDSREVVGVEIYREGEEVPPDLQPLAVGSCALVVVWTRAAW